MPFHLTTGGSITEIPTDNGQRANAEKAVLTTKDEWEAIAGAWPLKRLVEIWNALPGVTPVEKFTSRQIALERIWRAVESPEQARGKAQGKGGQAKVRSETAPKQPRCMPCSAVRKEPRYVRSRASPDGSDTVCAASFPQASVNRAEAYVRSSARANACTGSRAKL